MEYRHLGRSGLEVSVVGLGANNFGGRLDAKATADVVSQALDLGINLIDEADSYGGRGKSEEFVGKALGSRRHEAVIATKFSQAMGDGPMRSGTSRRYIMQAVEDSLRRLGTDYIDLYQIHVLDPQTPQEETLRALDDLVTQGKVRYLGHTRFFGYQIADTAWLARTEHLNPYISTQNAYNLLDRSVEAEIIPAAEAFGLGMLPYVPLAGGLLTGKYERGKAAPEGTRLASGRQAGALNDRNFDIVEALGAFAQERGHTLLELAFSWLATQPVVASVIAGATSPEQVRANAEAATWRLSAEELAAVDKITKK
ncbi:MAG: aldo/keto reductase [Dehalococcoidia bacterium]|nr:aldo/keto reductase [Dehalococcoidia bacterium]